MRTLQDLLPKLADYGGEPAVISFPAAGMAAMSHAELAARAGRLAGGLVAQGVRRGEPVAVFAPASPEWILAALAIMAAGAVVVPLDTNLSARALAHELADSQIRRVFATRETLVRLRAAAPEGWALDPYLLDVAEDGEAGRSWARLCGAPPEPLPEITPADPAALFYTSGTTGLPKGVPLTHANLLSNLEGLGGEGLARPGVRALVPLPLHHTYPFMVGLLVPLEGGAAIVLPAGISGPDMVRGLKEAGATAMIGVPRLYEALVTAIQRRAEARGGRLFAMLLGASIWLRRRLGWRAGRLLFAPLHRALAPNLRIVSSGGAALDAGLAWTLEGLGWQVLTGYGLTETSPIVTFTRSRHGRVGTAGRPLPGVELRTVPVSGLPGGEIQVRGPNVFSGYRNRPEADREAFTPDGWFRTGDLGVLDPEGDLCVLARVKETIVLADGKNVYPEEVEEAYAQSPCLREAAVLERAGVLSALVVPDMAALRRSGADDTAGLVREAVRNLSRGLPSHHRVTELRLTHEALPRTSLGKLRRHLLPDLFEAAGQAPASPAEAGPLLSASDRDLLRAPLAQAVLAWLEARYPDRRVTLDADPQTDLGIDSLAWVSLTLELEQAHGVRLEEAAITRISCVRDLIEEVLAARAQVLEPAAEVADPRRWLAPKGPLLRCLGVLLFVLNRLVLRLVFRLRVEGQEVLPQRGPFVLTPNHASFLDVFALAAALPRDSIGEVYWAGTTLYLFSSALRRLFSRVAQVFPVAAEGAPVSGFLLGTEVLGRGKILVWFPEGRRAPDGRLQSFMPGIGRLVEDPEGLFVPVHIKGAFEAWPANRRAPRPGPVTVRFAAPVTRRELSSRGSGSSEQERISGALHRELAEFMTKGGDE